MQCAVQEYIICTTYDQRLPNDFKASYGTGDNHCRNGILLPKLFWPTVRKYCSSDREKLFKFETEGQEFANFFKQWKFRTIFGNRMSSLTYPGGFSYLIN